MIKFGTLGAARITPPALIEPCEHQSGATVEVIGARSVERARVFAADHGIQTVVNSYAEVIGHPDVDAIYIPLPITLHHEWTLKALQAGKHVLCEKSFASNAREAEEMAAQASTSGLVVMDAFHYRYHPIFIRARELVASGELGDISQVSANFHVPVTDTGDIRMKYETAGGVTMDIGCYPISWVRHILADEPLQVSASAEIGPENVDVYLTTEMLFPNDIVVTTSGDMRAGTRFLAEIKVQGSRGSMVVNNPIAPHMGNNIKLIIDGVESVEKFTLRPTYSFQLDAFLAAINEGAPLFTDAQDAVKQMRVIDRCYQAAGLPLRGL